MSEELTPDEAKAEARTFLAALSETLTEQQQRTINSAGTVADEEREYSVSGTVRVTMRIYATSAKEAKRLGEECLKEAVRIGEVNEVDCPDAEEV